MPLAEPVNVESVLILKSDRLYAEMLRQYTFRVFRRVRVRWVATVDAAAASLAEEPADLLIAGTGPMLEGDIVDFLSRCGGHSGWVKRVLVVTAQREIRVLAALRALGVDGVFDTQVEAPEQFMIALRVIAAGARYWSTGILDEMQRNGADASSLSRVLTVFEQVVLSVIGDGSDDLVAADKLGLSPATVSTVRRELHRKLGVQHRGELVRLAAQNGFVCFTPSGVMRPGFSLLAAAYRARKSKRAVARAKDHLIEPSEESDPVVAPVAGVLAVAS